MRMCQRGLRSTSGEQHTNCTTGVSSVPGLHLGSCEEVKLLGKREGMSPEFVRVEVDHSTRTTRAISVRPPIRALMK